MPLSEVQTWDLGQLFKALAVIECKADNQAAVSAYMAAKFKTKEGK